VDHVLDKIEPRQAALWGNHTVKLRHTLADREMFSDTSIAELIDTVDPEHIKIETMPDDGYDVRAWASCDRTGLTGAEVLDAVRHGRIWIELKALEQVDPRFAVLLDTLYGELEAQLPSFKTFKRKLNLLVSSPNARVFYHFDVPGQTLIQLRGRKRIWIYPPTPPFLRPESVENTVRSVATEGLDYQAWFDDYAEVHDMEPGDLLHWALNGPHRVANHDALSVSLTTEHWTPEVRRSYAMNYGNGILRSVLGWLPRSRATTGAALLAKAGLTATWRLSGMQHKHSYRWVPTYRIDRDAPNCVRRIETTPPSPAAQPTPRRHP
jgi:hypothetical protein